MDLDIEFKNELTLEPNLEEHIKKYIEAKTFSRCINHEFKGYLSFPFDDSLYNTYYGNTSINNKEIYLPIEYFEKNDSLADEQIEFEYFIDSKTRDYNRASVNNIKYSKNEIKEMFFPNIDLENLEKYFKEYKYFMFIQGCDDGSKFIRFNSIEKRDEFLEKMKSFKSFDNLFDFEEEDFILFDFN